MKEARYFLDVTGSESNLWIWVKKYTIYQVPILNLVYLSLFNEFNDILEIYDELNNNFNTLS